jgi:hypothetical protein
MKVKDILKKIEDPKIYIEFKDIQSYCSYGFYTINELKYNDKYKNDNIKKINIQYIDNKRLLVLYI